MKPKIAKTPPDRRRHWGARQLALACSALCAGSCLLAVTSAALQIDFGVAAAADSSSDDAIGSASLKTDSEVTELLARADQFAKQGRYDLASTLWQTVIDSSNDLVFTRDEWVRTTLDNKYQRYRSVSGDIEGTLAKLPEEGLDGYRIKADGEAKLAMARPGADERETALAEVVRRYFLSSLGDDAAFELACRKLDRYEFLPAIRLLDKIIDEYPNPSVEKDEVLLRLAALNARVGDPARAMAYIDDLRSRVTPAVPDSVLAMVEADIKKSRGDSGSEDRGSALWPMAMGGPERRGLMPAPVAGPAADAAEGWAQPFGLVIPEDWPELPKDEEKLDLSVVGVEDPFAAGRARPRTSSSNTKKSTPKSMLEDWPKHGWYPASRALYHADRIYFKNNNRLVCADAATGELHWLGFRNQYPYPPVFAAQRNYGRTTTDESTGREPKGLDEFQNFADSVNQSMCIVRDKVLTIQGKPIDFIEENVPVAAAPAAGAAALMMARRGNNTQNAARYRSNRLVAYHARNGKLQWMRTATEPDAEAPKTSCFAGPPVPYAGLVLVPVLEERGMYLVAIETEGGATLWRTFLGDEPATTAPHSAIMVAVDGGEAYVATGAGLVFSVDAISGSMNWAVRYPRKPLNAAATQQQLRRFGGFSQVITRFDGWAEEMVIPAGNAVIVTPVDFDHVAAFDRRTGNLLWESARKPGEEDSASDYALGVHDGKFYAAGNSIVRCYRVSGGRMLWETPIEAGHGRGALTNDGIYMTSGKDKVVKIGLDDGKVSLEFAVATEGEQPVGNLYSDGVRLFGMGFQRVYSIAELDDADALERREAKAAREKEQAAAAAEREAALAESMKSLDGISGEVDRLLAGMVPAIKSAAGGDKTKLEAIISKMEAIGALLEKLPDPSAEVVARNRANFKERSKALQAEMLVAMEALIGDGAGVDALEGIGTLMEDFEARSEAVEPILKRFGFSEDD